MAQQRQPRLAIIGCGYIVEVASVLALRRIGWNPSVLIDPRPWRLDVVARKIGHNRKRVIKASSWQSVATEFDAALVAIPSALHGSMGTALAEAGKHVFMEKPLAVTEDECRMMTTAANRNGVILSVGLLRRYLRIARWTKALLASETLGAVEYFEAREGLVFDTDTGSEAQLHREMAGGGVLLDTGAHTLDLLLWWLGDMAPERYRDDAEGGVEADCVIDCRLATGGRGRIELSRTRDLCNSVRIEGTKGFVEVHLYKNEILAGSPNALGFRHDGISAQDMKPQFFSELVDSELRDFKTSASGGSRVGVSGSDGTKSVQLIEHCYAARQALLLPWSTGFSNGSAQSAKAPSGLPFGSKVLVTGATGFIGGRLVEQLVQQQGAQVRCIIRNSGRATRLARLPVEIMRADLASAADIEHSVRGMDYVFHCAYDVRSRRQNVEGLRNIVEACARHSVRRLVHVSTFAVYAPFPNGPLTEETRDGNRSAIYVNTKLDLEKCALDMARDCGVSATIVQPTIVYGPFCKPWTNSLAEMLIFGEVILPDGGQGLCNSVYIDDLTTGLILAAVSPAASGERYIMSGPNPVTWASFFTAFASALGTKAPTYRPREQISKATSGIIRSARLSLSDPRRLIKTIVRWNPAREILQSSLDAMPRPVRMLLMNYYFGGGGRRIGQVFLPDSQALALYTSKAVAGCEKARAELGYSPSFDFQSGMTLTNAYLEWAYGDIRRLAAHQQREPS